MTGAVVSEGDVKVDESAVAEEGTCELVEFDSLPPPQLAKLNIRLSPKTLDILTIEYITLPFSQFNFQDFLISSCSGGQTN